MTKIISIADVRARRAAEQARVDAHAIKPVDATDLAIITLSEDRNTVRGIGLWSPPGPGDFWELTPDQADELGMELIRLAQAAREMAGQ